MEHINLTIKAQLDTTSLRTAAGRWVKGTEIIAGWVRVTNRNKATAKAEATRKLQTWIDASDGPPKVVRFKSSAAVLTAIPTDRENEIGVAIVSTGLFPSGEFYCHQSSGSHDDWRTAKRYARQQLVSNGVDHLDDASVFEGYEFLLNHDQPDDAKGILRYAGFQRAHRAAPEGVDAHTWACENERRFQPEPAPAS